MLAMIRLTEASLDLAIARSCLPIEGFLQNQRLALWPLWKKAGEAETDALRKLADTVEGKGGGWGLLSVGGARSVKDGGVEKVCTILQCALYTT